MTAGFGIDPARQAVRSVATRRVFPQRENHNAMEILGVIVAGIIIGLLGKLVAPGGRDSIPLWLTVLCGVVGVIAGYYIAAGLGVEETDGIDWIRWLISIGVAAVAVMVAATLYGRRGTASLRR